MNPPPIHTPVGTWIGCGMCIGFAATCMTCRVWMLVCEGTRFDFYLDFIWGMLHVPVATAAILVLLGWADLRGLLAIYAAIGFQCVVIFMMFTIIFDQFASPAMLLITVSLLHIVVTSHFFGKDFVNYSRWYAARKRVAADSDNG